MEEGECGRGPAKRKPSARRGGQDRHDGCGGEVRSPCERDRAPEGEQVSWQFGQVGGAYPNPNPDPGPRFPDYLVRWCVFQLIPVTWMTLSLGAYFGFINAYYRKVHGYAPYPAFE